MTVPAYITNENVKFDGTLTPSAVLENSSGVKQLITYDSLSGGDQAVLDTAVTALGGTLPIAATSGSQSVNVGNKQLTDNTGLASATTYAFDIIVDGGAQENVTITTATLTSGQIVAYSDLINLLNTAVTNATASMSNGNLLFTSKTTGTTSSISIVIPSTLPANFLLTSLTGYVGVNAATVGRNGGVAGLKAYMLTNGTSFYDTYKGVIKSVGAKPAYTTQNKDIIYYDGTTWKYLYNDSPA